jgi:hypothetical protein
MMYGAPQMNNFVPEIDNLCGRSMNSEAFSHYSLPSNNFINGMRVNVTHNYNQQNEGISIMNPLLAQSINSSSNTEFNSAVRSNNTMAANMKGKDQSIM